jgi:hypothetical protein
MDISQGNFVFNCSGKMPDAKETTSIEHRACTVTVSVATLLGEVCLDSHGMEWMTINH